MSASVSVILDQSTLSTHVTLPEVNASVANELTIILRSYSEDVEYTTDGIDIPWHDFSKALSSIAVVLKRSGIPIEFDAVARRLALKTIDDKRGLRAPHAQVAQDGNDLVRHLQRGGFTRNLTLQQQRDVLKLLSLRHGANFSVPGAGKTTTLLAVHTVLKELSIVDTLLVVAPINAFMSWEDEISAIFSSHRKRVIRLTVANILNFHEMVALSPDVILVNYEKLRRRIDSLFPAFLGSKYHLVLDESHRIKSGYDNLSFRQIVQLGDLAYRRDIMSGTPMPQSVRDLEPQFDFLWSTPIESEVDPVDSNRRKLERIGKSISPLFVRTTKQELGLRNPTIEYRYIDMGPIQDELYGLLCSETARQLRGLDRASLYDFRRIGKSVVNLLQAATNPMLLGTDNEYYEDILPIPAGSDLWQLLYEFSKYEKPAKIEFLRNRIVELTQKDSAKKIVIWSYFVRNIQLLERLLSDFNPVTIHGSVPTGSDDDERNREGRIRKFHDDPTCQLLIANPQAAGEGISLHRVCHHAIYLDRNFNAAFFLQSIDRIHRLGLSPNAETNVEILMARGTIDDVLRYRLDQKTDAMGLILNDPYLMKLAYDPEDISRDEQLGLDSQDVAALIAHVAEK